MNQQLGSNLQSITPKETLLGAINDRWEKYLSHTSGLVHEIEEKLHDLVNRRIPQPESDKASIQRGVSDAVSAFESKLDQHSAINERLERVLKHLRECV